MIFHIDHIESFERSRKGNCYLLVIVDVFAKFTVIEPIKIAYRFNIPA